MAKEKKYVAFISCDKKDKKWAHWLQRKLEHYKLPSFLDDQTNLSNGIRPIYSDTSEFTDDVLSHEIEQALLDSSHLIVICSPNASQSKRINKEVQIYIESGNVDKIIPFIVSGAPYAKDSSQECLPSAIKALPSEQELLGININEVGRDAAAVKVIAKMFSLGFDALWQRHKRDQKKKNIRSVLAVVLSVIVLFSIFYWIFTEHEKAKTEQKGKQEILAKNFANSSYDLVWGGNSYLAQKLLLEVLPPKAPYTTEAETAFRNALLYDFVTLDIEYTDYGANFSPDGNYIVASQPGQLIIYDAHTRDIIKTFDTPRYESYSNPVFNPDGTRLMSTKGQFPKKIEIIDSTTGEKILSIEDYDESIDQAIYSPDGEQIAYSLYDHCIKTRDAHTGDVLNIIEGHDDYISSIAFNPDGDRIVSSSRDSTTRIWDVVTGKEIMRLESHEGLVNSAEYSPDGKLIATASNDKTIKLWDAEKGVLLKTLYGHTDVVNYISFSPDGEILASVSDDETILLWNVKSGNIIKKQFDILLHIEPTIRPVFSPDGKQLLAVSKAHGIMLSDVFGPYPIYNSLKGYSYNGNDIATTIAYSQDGKTIAIALRDGYVIILDAETGKEIRRMNVTTYYFDFISSIVFSDNNLLATVSDNSIKIWDFDTGECIDSIIARDENESFLAVRPDFKQAISNPGTYRDDSLYVLNLENKKTLFKIIGCSEASFSQDGIHIATNTRDNAIMIWDSKTGALIHRLEGHTDGIRSIHFDQDGKRIVSASHDNTVSIWDVEKGQVIRTFSDHNRPVLGASFSPDGKYVLSFSEDATLKIWDAESGNVHLSIDKGLATCACFNQDGSSVISAYDAGPIIYWNFPSLEELIKQTQERFKDDPPTDEEYRMYHLK